jgi:aspartyl-tRNA(Asn)/glutamyl-tRNA(Gln) amidotransferase subunit A
MYLEDIFTVPASVAGLPALTVPGGAVSVDGASLPLGLQMTGPHGREDALFALGKKFSSGYNQNNAGTP